MIEETPKSNVLEMGLPYFCNQTRFLKGGPQGGGGGRSFPRVWLCALGVADGGVGELVTKI